MAAMEKAANTVIPYEDERGKHPFMEWALGLRDDKARGAIFRKIEVMEKTVSGKDIKAVGEGVSEARVHYGPGYRIYFGQQGSHVFILLCGGDKSTQQKDIKRAQAYWRDHKRRNQT